MKIKLDYKINSLDKRREIVEEICEKYGEELTNYNLEQLSNYLIFQMEEDEKRERRILTPNRMATVNKRETSFEGVKAKFKHNKDGIYNIIHEDKNTILSPKKEITKEDISDIPFLKQIRDSIDKLKGKTDKDYITQKSIIELSQSQYIIKEAYKPTLMSKTACVPDEPVYAWDEILDFTDWKVVKEFIKHYVDLRVSAEGELEKDIYWILEDFESIAKEALDSHPKLYDIMILKMKNTPNSKVRESLLEDYGETYSVEYISSLYNNKIPKLISEEAYKRKLIYHYTFKEKGEWKKCNRCGEIKLLHPMFFSKNTGNSNSGFYSICKECRNKKRKV